MVVYGWAEDLVQAESVMLRGQGLVAQERQDTITIEIDRIIHAKLNR